MAAVGNGQATRDSDAKEESALAIENLEVAYNEVILALRGISLSVAKGSICALLGANGAGKTTLLRAISGVLKSVDGRVTEGTITFEGDRIEHEKADHILRRGVAHVPEGRRVFADMSVEDNLRAAAFTRRNRAGVNEAYERVMTYFPVLRDRPRQIAGYLSGGEQQMLAVGRALMIEPKLLLLDEPSLGLAPLIIEEIVDIIRQVNEEQGVSVLLVEQNAALALEMASEAYVMENGRIVLEGTSQEIRENEDIKEFYLGMAEGQRKSYAAVKHYRRRKRWLS